MPDGASARVVVLVRDGCHLCDDAVRIIEAVCRDAEASWRAVDVDSDDGLRARYTDHVPVTFVDGRQHDFWRVDPDRLRTVNRRYAELTPVVTAQHELDLATGDLEAARELAAEDAAFAVEVPALEEAIRLSCQRRDLLERIATDSEALARANTAHPGHATLARRAADDRAAVEACHDVDRLRLSR